MVAKRPASVQKTHTTVSPGVAHVHVIMYFNVLEFVV